MKVGFCDTLIDTKILHRLEWFWENSKILWILIKLVISTRRLFLRKQIRFFLLEILIQLSRNLANLKLSTQL